MQWPLVLAGLALGLAAAPHCALMCGAPCAALTRNGARGAMGFHGGRLIGYAAAGAIAAAGVAAIGAWSRTGAPALRPLWTLLHLAFLALGVWWLVAGAHPAWMRREARAGGSVPIRIVGRDGRACSRHTLRAACAGLAWAAWPCAALQSALLLAALADGAPGGALVMGAYAAASAPGLAAAPWVWARWARWRAMRAGSAGAVLASEQRLAAIGYRTAGAALMASSGWALGHGLWERVAAWCSGG